MGKVVIKKALLANWIEVRIKGEGKSGKGDRYELVSANDAVKLAIDLLTKAETILSASVKRS